MNKIEIRAVNNEKVFVYPLFEKQINEPRYENLEKYGNRAKIADSLVKILNEVNNTGDDRVIFFSIMILPVYQETNEDSFPTEELRREKLKDDSFNN